MLWQSLSSWDVTTARLFGAFSFGLPTLVLLGLGALRLTQGAPWVWIAAPENGEFVVLHYVVGPMLLLAATVYVAIGPSNATGGPLVGLYVFGCIATAVTHAIGQSHSAAVQLFFIFVAIVAAYILRPVGAYVVAVSACIAELILVGATAGLEKSMDDWLAVIAVTFGTTIAVVRSRVTEHHTSRRLEDLAHLDPLTGLITRDMLERLIREGQTEDRDDGLVCVMLIDIDRFKWVNDTHGHPAGDHVLRLLAAALTRHLAECGTPARIGGDEFAAVMPGVALTGAVEAAQGVLAAFEKSTRDDADVPACTVSIGVVEARGGQHDLERIYACADAALYKAKEAGRNCVRSQRLAGSSAQPSAS